MPLCSATMTGACAWLWRKTFLMSAMAPGVLRGVPMPLCSATMTGACARLWRKTFLVSAMGLAMLRSVPMPLRSATLVGPSCAAGPLCAGYASQQGAGGSLLDTFTTGMSLPGGESMAACPPRLMPSLLSGRRGGKKRGEGTSKQGGGEVQLEGFDARIARAMVFAG